MAKNNGLIAIDFFCGAGGMTYGLSLAGIKVIAGIDIDGTCKETYAMNNPNAKFILADMSKLTVQHLREMTGIKANDNKLVFIGCSPCQYWTRLLTDKTKASKTKNLLNYFRKFIAHFMPGHIIIENVPGILTRSKESKIYAFINFLKRNNYTLDYDIINANEYGVPQTRKRFVLVASRVGKAISLPTKQPTRKPVVSDFIGVRNGFPKLKHGNYDDTDVINTTSRLTDINLKRLQKTPHNGGTRLAWKDDATLQLSAYVGKDGTFVDTYGRLFWDKPASTITTKFHSISNGRFAHPTENRGLSLREGATLQTFPVSYTFKGNGIGSIARQIGNAVPPELAKKIALSLIEQING